jgi:tRNA dimethylallyltransferase
MPRRPILIAGPTASGKSALAVALARELGGLVVNADSMQVYAGLRVLTARPSDAELALAPHALYGHVPPSQAFSVAQWLADVSAVLAAARAAGQVPIIVGGTGLYFKALLEGLSPIPPVPDAVRNHWRAEGERLGVGALHAVLAARDPIMGARLSPTDPQRITRALEVLEATGRSLSHWQSQPGAPLLRLADAAAFVVHLPRAALQARADHRFSLMIAQGALAEVSELARLALADDLPVMGALGVAPLLAHVRGTLTLEEAVTRAQLQTRQYIKRQETWLRRFMADWNWTDGTKASEASAAAIALLETGEDAP